MAVAAATLCWFASAQEGDTGAPPSAAKADERVVTTSATAAAQPESRRGSSQGSALRLSPYVEGILQMSDAGVSKGVIKAYVERQQHPCSPTPADLIALKEHSVPDEIATALLKAAAEARPEASQPSAGAPAPALYASAPSYALLDPEGYDYFRSYYLLPRTLASVNERLAPYNPPFSYGYPYAYPYSYGRSLRFSPRSSAGYPHRRDSRPHAW